MTTIVINEKTKKGRIILDLIREMGVGEIIESKKVSSHILDAHLDRFIASEYCRKHGHPLFGKGERSNRRLF